MDEDYTLITFTSAADWRRSPAWAGSHLGYIVSKVSASNAALCTTDCRLLCVGLFDGVCLGVGVRSTVLHL